MQGNVNIPDSTITTNLSFRQLVLMNMQQLTNFPYIENDFDALTDYELLCLVVKYLNDVIANQNEQNDSITRMYESFLELQTYINNTKDTLEDAFNTLDNYVRNYFANLNVQDEIDHKLDEMVEDGTLEHIIASYLQTQKIYNTHDEMVADASNLVDDLNVQTLGYHSLNDGGGAFYKITNTESLTDYQEEIATDLYATLIVTNEIHPEMFGAYGDGVHDDTTAIQTALNLNYPLKFNKKTYLADNLIAPEKSVIDGNLCTIKAPNTSNAILTIYRDSSISNIKLEGKSANELSLCGLKFSNQGYRINLYNITAEYCTHGIKDTNGIWSVTANKLFVKNCANGLAITEGVSTSFTLDNFVHENCGNPMYCKYVNYSNFGSIYGDYANGGEESTWAYPNAYGQRSNYVFRFVGCKGLNINALGGEHNVGVNFLRIEYSDININNLYVIYQTSYDTSVNRALISVTGERSCINLGLLNYTRDVNVTEQAFDNYYDYPYDVTTYGLPNYTLFSYLNGNTTTRTPKEICKRNSTTILADGYEKHTIQRHYIGNTNTSFVIEYQKNISFYLPIRQTIEIVLTTNASNTAIIKGEISGSIMFNDTLRGIFKFSQQKDYDTDYTDITVTKTNNKITIPLPAGMTVAWVKVDNIGNLLDYSYHFE